MQIPKNVKSNLLGYRTNIIPILSRVIGEELLMVVLMSPLLKIKIYNKIIKHNLISEMIYTCCSCQNRCASYLMIHDSFTSSHIFVSLKKVAAWKPFIVFKCIKSLF